MNEPDVSLEHRNDPVVEEKISKFNELAAIHRQLKELGGVDKATVVALESIQPGIITSKVNINGFTTSLSKTNYDLTVKQVEVAMEDFELFATIGLAIAAVIGFIMAMFGMGGGGGGGGSSGGGGASSSVTAAASSKRNIAVQTSKHDTKKSAQNVTAGKDTIRDRSRNVSDGPKLDMAEFKRAIDETVFANMDPADSKPLQAKLHSASDVNACTDIVLKGAEQQIINRVNKKHSVLCNDVLKNTERFKKVWDSAKKIEAIMKEVSKTPALLDKIESDMVKANTSDIPPSFQELFNTCNRAMALMPDGDAVKFQERMRVMDDTAVYEDIPNVSHYEDIPRRLPDPEQQNPYFSLNIRTLHTEMEIMRLAFERMNVHKDSDHLTYDQKKVMQRALELIRALFRQTVHLFSPIAAFDRAIVNPRVEYIYAYKNYLHVCKQYYGVVLRTPGTMDREGKDKIKAIRDKIKEDIDQINADIDEAKKHRPDQWYH